MKKKLLSFLLSIAVVFTFMPFFTIQADAFSTGSKTLLKTKTVTIKPGKTYTSPTFKLSKKMAVQVPVTVTLPGKIKDSDYEYLLKYTMTLRHSNGKKVASYKCPETYMYNFYDDAFIYEDWIHYYKKSISKPCFAKGKYYITIKNTTKRAIKVKYSVKGYTKYASTAELKKNLTADNDDIYVYAGKIGPGIPYIKSVKSSNSNVSVGWFISHDGKLYLYPENYTTKDCKTTVTVTLANKKTKYKIKLKVKGPVYDD